MNSQINLEKVYVYPTDTIYGIGCDATNDKLVLKIRDIKKREEKPFSIIAPSKKWIKENFEIIHPNYLDKLPGPYTLVMKPKNEKIISKHVSYSDKVGVRIPDCEFSKLVKKTGKPFVTTSVNISGEPHLVDPKNLKKEIKDKVDIVIDEGKLSGKASTVIDVSEKEPIILRK